MKEHDDRLYCLALHGIQGLGGFAIRQLISHVGSSKRIFEVPRGKLMKIPGIGTKTLDLIQGKEALIEKAAETFQKARSNNTSITCYFEKEFPRLLKNTADTPTLLYIKGNCEINDRKIISIVGSRKASSYGLGMVKEIIEGLKVHNPVIVSGLAYGIDVESHKIALKNGLDTIAVMASGVNVIYPALHRDVAREILDKNGALISEYTFDELPEPGKFPARNRIIAGISEATIVVEAAEKGGALITADIANSYDREVFAIPGNVHNKFSKGCNNLIKSHKASCLTKPEDIEYVLGWDRQEQATVKQKREYNDCDTFEVKVLNALEPYGEGLMIDELSWRSEVPMNKLASILLNLEFRGYVNSLPGKMYKLAV